MDKKTLRAVTGWILNTNVDIDKIADHYGIRKDDKESLRKYAAKLREERNKQWEKEAQERRSR